jgi:3-methyladenine DNA glycosylase/8-oxoguanine DNA glycosylase
VSAELARASGGEVGGAGADRTRRIDFAPEIDPTLTLAALWRGPADRQMAFEGSTVLIATRTPTGPASVRMRFGRGQAWLDAWGPGADDALDRVPGMIGALDEQAELATPHPVIQRLQRRLGGMRMTRSAAVFETLVPTIIGQKVSGIAAGRSFGALLRRFGEPAPGPFRLLVPPAPDDLRRQPYHAFHTLGLERRRADAIRHAAAEAERLERIHDLPRPEARRRLLSVPGIGPWSAAETMRLALGDPDAVSVGDYNVPHLVCWALAGEPRGTDSRMLELLEPYRGQRARVVRLLELSGRWPPRFGPRIRLRSIAGI